VTAFDPSAGPRAHSALVAEIELALGALPYVFMLHINVFAGQRAGTENWTRSAPKGTPDFLCSVIHYGTGFGLFLAIDAKTGSACLTKEQRNFRDSIRKFGGGFFAEVHSVADAIDAVERVRLFGCERGPVAATADGPAIVPDSKATADRKPASESTGNSHA
jgi:hypothetical protein